MQIDYIVLGKVPVSEHYPEDKKFRETYANKVILAYMNQLKRCFPCFPDRFSLRQMHPTEEFLVAIDFTNEQEFEYARNVADDLPYCWDEQAQKDLGKQYFKDLRDIICKINTPNSSLNKNSK